MRRRWAAWTPSSLPPASARTTSRARKWACEGLEFMGVKIDDARNEAAHGEAKISADDSRVQVWVIPTNEETRHRARYAGNRYEKNNFTNGREPYIISKVRGKWTWHRR